MPESKKPGNFSGTCSRPGIPDAPKLLDRLDLNDRTVAGGAMFWRKSIVAKIVEKRGGCVLPVKDTQKSLREHIQAAFDNPVFSLVSFESGCEMGASNGVRSKCFRESRRHRERMAGCREHLPRRALPAGPREMANGKTLKKKPSI